MRTRTTLFQHRHYVAIAAIIATLTDNERAAVADTFATALHGTNPNFNRDRFFAAAIGKPQTGRDKQH
jgi:hypothetical protein